ncbi:porin [Amylibacter sp.]|nr:porin [Amylibacter sp.]
MKKLLIATTALVATAGMASAEITMSGTANAGYHTGLATPDGAAFSAPAKGIYSNAGVVLSASTTTDGGLTLSTSIDAEAGTEIDQGDFEFDNGASGSFGFGNVTVSGAFGTLVLDDDGIDNLYDDDLTSADISFSTSVGAVSLALAIDTDDAADGTSVSAGYSAGAMTFSASGSSTSTDNSMALAVSYVVSDNMTLTADTDSKAGGSAVNSVGISTSINGVSVSASSDSNSEWDVDLGYTVSGVALTYGVDESSDWDATASYTLGGGASVKAGMNSNDAAYAGISFSF